MSTENTFYVNFADIINEAKIRAIMSALAEIVGTKKPDTLYCLVSSYGGNIEDAVVLYNFLRALPVNLVMHNSGHVDSCAIVPFLAADKRLATEQSSFLIHGATWTFPPQPIDRALSEQMQSMWSTSETKLAGIVTARTKLKSVEIAEMSRIGVTKDANFALAKGIIHAIEEPSVPKDAPFFSFNIP